MNLYIGTKTLKTGLVTLGISLTLSACSGSRTAADDGSGDYVAGEPMAIEPNPSDGIVGRPSYLGQTSGSSGIEGATSGGSTSGISGGNTNDSGSTTGGTSSGGETTDATTTGDETSGNTTASDSGAGESNVGETGDGATTGGQATGGQTTGGGGSGNGSVPGAVELGDNSETTITYPTTITSIDLQGVEVDQPFSIELDSYTATAGYLTSSVGVVINGEASYQVPLTGANTTIIVNSAASDQQYTFDITRENANLFFELSYLKDSEGASNGQFGSAVAIHGDRIAVIGRGDEERVSVFRREGASWTLETVLRIRANSVDLFENTLVIGDTAAEGRNADGRNLDGFGLGKVHVYTLEDGGWQPQASLFAQHRDEGDNFGYAVTIDGDTLAVGAPRENSAATGINSNAEDDSALDAGAVYVFVRDGSKQWRQQAYIKGDETGGGDKFGFSVDLYENRLAVGAIGEESRAIGINGNQSDNGLFSAGAAYIFRSDNGNWSQEAFIKPNTPASGDLFGSTVALQGSTVAVGAIGDDTAASNGSEPASLNSGAVYVFAYRNGAWQQQAKIKGTNTGDSDGFGSALALEGNTLVVGAQFEDSSARLFNGNVTDNSSSNAGAVYVFNRNADSWPQVLYIHASNADSGDNFSGSGALALHQGTLVVGAPGESSPSVINDNGHADNSAARAGAAYVYR